MNSLLLLALPKIMEQIEGLEEAEALPIVAKAIGMLNTMEGSPLTSAEITLLVGLLWKMVSKGETVLAGMLAGKI